MTEKQFILADGHVHLYNFFSLNELLNSAWRNFEIAFRKRYKGRDFDGVLFLTEAAEQNSFFRFKQEIDRKSYENMHDRRQWKLFFTKEVECLKATRGEKQNIFIVAGRQITTSENLEVLALGTTKSFESGLSLKKTIGQIVDQGAMAVIPWGVGKWLGKRGKFLTELILNNRGSNLFLGDNGGRPLFWSGISQFKLADERGIKILRGTDPLPMQQEVRRPGNFGFMISERLNHERPCFHLKQLLTDSRVDLINYGKLENSFRFLRNRFFLRKKIAKKNDPKFRT